MDNPVLIIEMPDLSDEAVARLEEFFHAVINTFENQYSFQLKRHYQKLQEE